MNNSVPLLDLLDKDNYTVRPTIGTSMEPLLHENSTLVVIVKNFSNLKKGDIVLFQRECGSFVLHRITKIKGDCFFIRGDNCNYYDKVTRSQIKGFVVQIYRDGKFFDVNKSVRYKLYKHKVLILFAVKDKFDKIMNVIRYIWYSVKRFVRGHGNEN